MAAVDALQGHGTTLAAHACHQIARHACPEPPLNSGRISEHFLLEQTLARCVASTQPLHAACVANKMISMIGGVALARVC